MTESIERRPAEVAEVARRMGQGPRRVIALVDRREAEVVALPASAVRAVEGTLARGEEPPPDEVVEEARDMLEAEGDRYVRVPYPSAEDRLDLAIEVGEDVESDVAFEALEEALRRPDPGAALPEVWERFPGLAAARDRVAVRTFSIDARFWLEDLGLAGGGPSPVAEDLGLEDPDAIVREIEEEEE